MVGATLPECSVPEQQSNCEVCLERLDTDLQLRCNLLLPSTSAPPAAHLSTDQAVSRQAMQASGKPVSDWCKYKSIYVACMNHQYICVVLCSLVIKIINAIGGIMSLLHHVCVK